MAFAAGLLVGVAAGAVLVIVVRQAARGPIHPSPALATVLAVLALVVAVIALVRHDPARSPETAAAGADAPELPTITTAPPPSAAPSTTLGATVVMPNLIGTARVGAVAKLQSLGLVANVETLALASTPEGYVVSQTPLPESRLPRGSTATLVVSGAR